MKTTLIFCAIGALACLVALIVYAWWTTKKIDGDVKAACDFQPVFPANKYRCLNCKKEFQTDYEACFCCAERKAEMIHSDNGDPKERDLYADQFDKMA